MGSKILNKLLLLAGFASLAHAAFSAAHRELFLLEILHFSTLKIVIHFSFRSHLFAAHRTGLEPFATGCEYFFNRIKSLFLNYCFVQIVFQTVVSLVIVIYNLIQVVGNFKEIRATVDMQEKSWDTLGNLPSFYSFNHRGKALHPAYEKME